jgi:hypothetical protein
LEREVFFLAYHLHWGVEDVTALPTSERWAYVRLLSEQLESEQRAMDEARRA